MLFFFATLSQKGDGDWETVVEEEAEFRRRVRRRNPGLAYKPVFNDEADPEKGWWKPRAWRAGARYAALVAMLAMEAEAEAEEDRLKLMSSDNAFLNDPSSAGGHFQQRTMTTRFVCGNDSEDGRFVQKPVFNGFALLALLGDEKVQAETVGNASTTTTVRALAAASRSGDSLSILLVNSDAEDGEVVRVKLNGVPPPDNSVLGEKYLVYSVSDGDTDPWRTWTSQESPTCPDGDQLRRLRAEAALKRAVSPRHLDRTRFDLEMPPGSLKLLVVCLPRTGLPEQPTGLEAVGADVLAWRYRGQAECLDGFEVERSRGGPAGPFEPVVGGAGGGPVMNFVHLEDDDLRGWWYRVRTRDVWNRHGPHSAPYLLE